VVDRPNVRVVGIANTTTIRAAGRSLKNTTITAATSVEAAVELLRTGAADAFALSRDSLPPFVAQLPGSRIVDGGFQQTGIAIAVAKGRPGVLAYVSAFLEHAKASGSGWNEAAGAPLLALEQEGHPRPGRDSNGTSNVFPAAG